MQRTRHLGCEKTAFDMLLFLGKKQLSDVWTFHDCSEILKKMTKHIANSEGAMKAGHKVKCVNAVIERAERVPWMRATPAPLILPAAQHAPKKSTHR